MPSFFQPLLQTGCTGVVNDFCCGVLLIRCALNGVINLGVCLVVVMVTAVGVDEGVFAILSLLVTNGVKHILLG